MASPKDFENPDVIPDVIDVVKDAPTATAVLEEDEVVGDEAEGTAEEVVAVLDEENE